MPDPVDLASLSLLLNGRDPCFRGFLDAGGSAIVARAPGRLDVLGGIADYSGSLVLEYPLAEAAWVLLQPRADGRVRFRSAVLGRPPMRFETTTRALGATGEPLDPGRTAHLFSGRNRWAAYVAGCWTVLAARRPDLDLSGGANLLLASNVPPGAGVSSSAAIEVATMRALSAGIDIDGLELALWCQQVENRVAGAPCGIMDQVTSALGRESEMLALRCQPHEIVGDVPFPNGITVAGLDTGVKHAVGGSAYARARVAAFMGLRILTERIGADRLGGYLANLTVEAFEREYEALLPEAMSGSGFLDRYGATIDTVTRVDPAETYSIRACASFPIRENRRAQDFASSLQSGSVESAGALMYESHRGYGECGIGSDEADALVESIRRAGPRLGLFGARATGGGSGGTVAVLMRDDVEARNSLAKVCKGYEGRYGSRPSQFTGSSPGAMSWEPRRIDLSSLA